ncbi:MAG: hypothetical protein HYY80_00580 [Chloroflexi bacterium]|nr:hypothetical protein [Chloroflexota bacterium]
MCYLCDEYGDPEFGDGVWYLNPKNYARNMYTLRLPDGATREARGAETGSEIQERAWKKVTRQSTRRLNSK